MPQRRKQLHAVVVANQAQLVEKRRSLSRLRQEEDRLARCRQLFDRFQQCRIATANEDRVDLAREQQILPTIGQPNPRAATQQFSTAR